MLNKKTKLGLVATYDLRAIFAKLLTAKCTQILVAPAGKLYSSLGLTTDKVGKDTPNHESWLHQRHLRCTI